VVAGGIITYQCSYNATYGPLDTDEVLYPPTTIDATIDTGWDVGIASDSVGQGSLDGDGVAQIRAPAAQNLDLAITITVKAPADGAEDSVGALTLTATIPSDCVSEGRAVTDCSGTETTGTARISTTIIGNPSCADLAGTPVTASLVGGTLPSVPFSFESRIVSAQLEVQVSNPSQCVGWVIDISATNLAYTGPAAPGQDALPASNLRVIPPDASEVGLGSAQQLVSEGGPNSSYTLTFDIELVIPGGTPAGTYSSTVTISTTARP
jgi:hypothetical protein